MGELSTSVQCAVHMFGSLQLSFILSTEALCIHRRHCAATLCTIIYWDILCCQVRFSALPLEFGSSYPIRLFCFASWSAASVFSLFSSRSLQLSCVALEFPAGSRKSMQLSARRLDVLAASFDWDDRFILAYIVHVQIQVSSVVCFFFWFSITMVQHTFHVHFLRHCVYLTPRWCTRLPYTLFLILMVQVLYLTFFWTCCTLMRTPFWCIVSHVDAHTSPMQLFSLQVQDFLVLHTLFCVFCDSVLDFLQGVVHTLCTFSVYICGAVHLYSLVIHTPGFFVYVSLWIFLIECRLILLLCNFFLCLHITFPFLHLNRFVLLVLNLAWNGLSGKIIF